MLKPRICIYVDYTLRCDAVILRKSYLLAAFPNSCKSFVVVNRDNPTSPISRTNEGEDEEHVDPREKGGTRLPIFLSSYSTPTRIPQPRARAGSKRQAASS